MCQNFVYIVCSAVACCFGSEQGTAVFQTFTCQYAIFPAAFDSLVLAIQEADFSAAYADVTSGNVNVGTDVSVKFCHECLAESHDFHIGFAVRVEVGTTLAAADRQTCQGVFEDLFKAQEFNNAGVYVGSETQTALVRPDCRAELYSETSVYVYLTSIVYPCNSERNLSFRLYQSFQQTHFFIFGVQFYFFFDRSENFFYCLDEFRFMCVTSFNLFDYAFNISVHNSLTSYCLYNNN